MQDGDDPLLLEDPLLDDGADAAAVPEQRPRKKDSAMLPPLSSPRVAGEDQHRGSLRRPVLLSRRLGPKTTKQHIAHFKEQLDGRFHDYWDPATGTLGYCPALKEAIAALERNKYVSLAEVQREREVAFEAGKGPGPGPAVDPSTAGPTERLYVLMLPQMGRFIIAILALLKRVGTLQPRGARQPPRPHARASGHPHPRGHGGSSEAGVLPQ